jgi:hypothetical protein
MYLNSYVIFEKRLENNAAYNKLRGYLNNLGLTEETIDDGMNVKKNHKFIWFRYINLFGKKALDSFYDMSFFLTNIIPKIDCVTDKYILYENMRCLFPDTFFKMMPYSFKVTKDTIYEKGTICIARPVNIKKFNTAAGCGYGISVYDSEETLQIVKNKLPEFDVIISSKYITNPLLFQEKKFHLRCHMFITIINNKLSGHVCDIYKILVAMDKYKNEDYQNIDIHDTHHLGPADKNYLFPHHFIRENISNIEFNDSTIPYIYDQIRNICKHVTIIAAKNVKLQSNAENSFHLLGCDFLIDSNLNVMLLECNKFSDISGNKNGNYKIFLDRFWEWVNHIILKPAFLNDNACDKDAVYIENGNFK